MTVLQRERVVCRVVSQVRAWSNSVVAQPDCQRQRDIADSASVPLMGDVEDYEVGLDDRAGVGTGLIVPDGMGAGGRTVAPGWPPVYPPRLSMPRVGRAVFSAIDSLLCAVERANDLHPGDLPSRYANRYPRLLPKDPASARSQAGVGSFSGQLHPYESTGQPAHDASTSTRRSRRCPQALSSWWTRWNDTPTASPMSRSGTWSASSWRTSSIVNTATLRSASRAVWRSASICRRR